MAWAGTGLVWTVGASGVLTQVLVVEFMPALPIGEFYVGWLQRADGAWKRAGRFALDSNGYGRIILVGNDGYDIHSVIVTRQSVESAAPRGPVVLRWP